MMNNTRDEKNALRATYRKKREALDPALCKAWDSAICEAVAASASFRYADVVLAYSPFGFEIDITPLLSRTLALGKRLALPRTYGKGLMSFHYVNGLDGLSPGSYGILEPSEDAPLYEDTPATLCLVPGILFDRRGLRIGYGGGYYERFLRDHAVNTLGIIYRDFVLPTVPGGRYDRHVAALATERGILPTRP